jgi:signal transduction histidine kinase
MGRRLFTVFMRDISDLKEAQARILQSERLAAIGKAMAGLVHESRNALQRSQAGLERLARRVAHQPGAPELIEAVQRAQEDLHRLYEEVREYAAPVRIHPQLVSMDECLHEAWEHLGVDRNERRANLKVDSSAADTCCEFDPFALRQVFRNVLENSLAACDDPVELEVRFLDDALEGRPALSVSIRDNGPGLSSEQQARMFDEFYTTKTHGTGLGLPIARRLVEVHRGRIAAASSRAGKGTEVIITLPRRQA